MTKLQQYIITFLFFLSGCGSIQYQVIWQRYLTFSFGSDTVSSTILVAIFMLGLGIGSYIGGKVSDKINTKKRLGYYVLIEILIGIFGALSHYFLYEIIYQKISYQGDWITILTSFFFLIPPTIAMGTTLPLLSKLSEESLSTTKMNSYLLYAFNTLGASAGAFIPLFLIIPHFGFEKTLLFAVTLNLICAGVCLFYYSLTPQKNEIIIKEIQNEPIPNKEHSIISWYILFGLSGFSSIALEMIWFRVLNVMLKGNSFTFSLLLCIYLGGIAIGSFIGLLIIKKIKNPDQFFFRIQALIILYALVSILALIWGINHLNGLHSFEIHLYSYDIGYVNHIFLHLILPVFLLLIPTMLMGISFVCLQEASNVTFKKFAEILGKLLFFNIVFSSLGTLIVTFIFFHHWGTSATLKFLSLLMVFILCYKLFYRDTTRKNKIESIVFILSLLILTLAFPNNFNFWKSIQGSNNKEIVLMEDKSCVSSIKLNHKELKRDIVFINGLGQSSFPYLGDTGHIQLGFLPLLIHSKPEKVAIIGFGSGSTLFASVQSESIKQVDCFEIAENQFDLVHQYGKMKGDSNVLKLFNDNRINLIKKDGRKALLNSLDKYDIIEADALRPNSPYSGNIYSKEYFELIKTKLNKNGIAVTWCPTQRIKNSFCNVFPFVVGNKFLLIGSNSKIDSKNLKLLENPDYKSHPWYSILTNFEAIESNSFSNDVNHDWFPKDEFSSATRIVKFSE